ncbi:hypothetical protein [Ancylomarina sp.]|uniref:hypothetical protein n=1 Tax=Ancylomarina sp. TaxID=1970196 RepID=UPI003567CF88
MHEKLGAFNKLRVNAEYVNSPMIYPFMIKDETKRTKLVDSKVFVAQYWPNVLDWSIEDDVEYDMLNFIMQSFVN